MNIIASDAPIALVEANAMLDSREVHEVYLTLGSIDSMVAMNNDVLDDDTLAYMLVEGIEDDSPIDLLYTS